MLALAVAMWAAGDLDAPPGVREIEHSVSVEIEPPFATFSVTTTLKNIAGRDAEAIFRLTLPEGAAVHAVEVARGDVWLAADARTPQEARAVYADVVHPASGATRPVPAIALLPDDGDRVRLQIFPVPAGGTVRIRLHAIAPIRFSGGAYRFEYPARAGSRLAPATIALGGAEPRTGGGDLVVPAEAEAFALHAAAARGAGVWVSAERPIEADGPVDVVLVVDRSASMQLAARRDATALVLRRFLTALPDGSRVAAVTFGRAVYDRLPAGAPRDLLTLTEVDPRWEAPGSGSDLGAALVAAGALLPVASRPRHIVVVTDGRFEGTARTAPLPPGEGGLDPDVQVSALVVAPCVGTAVLGAVVAARAGTMRCDLDRASSGDVDRAVRAVARQGEVVSFEAGTRRALASVRPGEQATVFLPAARVPSAVVVQRADSDPARVLVREVSAARALVSPSAFVWVDASDLHARERLAGRRGRGPASGSGLPERSRPAIPAPGLGSDTLHRVLQRSYLPAVRGCFLRHAPRQRAPVSLVVEGAVEEAEATDVSVRGASGDLEACLLERARTVIYPWSAGSVRFRWPITYRPEREPPDAAAPPETR